MSTSVDRRRFVILTCTCFGHVGADFCTNPQAPRARAAGMRVLRGDQYRYVDAPVAFSFICIYWSIDSSRSGRFAISRRFDVFCNWANFCIGFFAPGARAAGMCVFTGTPRCVQT